MGSFHFAALLFFNDKFLNENSELAKSGHRRINKAGSELSDKGAFCGEKNFLKQPDNVRQSLEWIDFQI